jgi:hypothetical protein
LQIDADLDNKLAPITTALIVLRPSQEARKVFALTRSRHLLSFGLFTSDLGVETLLDNVGDFFISSDHSLLFVTQAHSILIAPIDRPTFSPFHITSEIAIGIEPALSSVVLLHDLSAGIVPYFEYSILTRLDSGAAIPPNLIRSFANSRKSVLIQVTVMALRQKRCHQAVRLLRLLPSDRFDDILVPALRAVEKDERGGVFAEIGSPLEYFNSLAGVNARTFDSNIVFFEKISPAKDAAALFLPVLLDECGPTVAFPAAIFFLREAGPTIESLLRFIDPILGKAVAVDTEKVSCDGMIFEIAAYTELRMQLEEAVTAAWKDLMERCVRPDLALKLCNQTRMSFAGFARQNSELALKYRIEELTERCVGGNEFNGEVGEQLEKVGWWRWATVVWITIRNNDRIRRIAEEHPEIAETLRNQGLLTSE